MAPANGRNPYANCPAGRKSDGAVKSSSETVLPSKSMRVDPGPTWRPLRPGSGRNAGASSFFECLEVGLPPLEADRSVDPLPCSAMPSFHLELLDDAMASFLDERHLATLTVTRGDGSLHVTPVGFTYEPAVRLARVITWADSWKARHVDGHPGGPVAICSVDGGRWVTMYGAATLSAAPEAIAEGVRRYTARYRAPKERADRVVIEVRVNRMIGRV